MHPDLLIGIEDADDAGVFKIAPDLALVQTLDFFTPVVDDPYMFGQIAAANSLSDVYAMGGRPLTVMNIACFPAKNMDTGELRLILKGALDKVNESGALLVGGHSVEDDELKFGLSVTGVVHPDRIFANRGARPGDLIILTKPLGTGIIATGIKAGFCPEPLAKEAARVMAFLNMDAASATNGMEIHACTDVTGFGLIGHMTEVAKASRVGMRLKPDSIPVFKGLESLSNMGMIPGGLYANREYFGCFVHVSQGVDQIIQDVIYDPQTSGGLLIFVMAGDAEKLLERINDTGISQASVIGEVIAEPGVIYL